MPRAITKEYIRVPKEEYLKLKGLQKRFQSFWQYIQHLNDVREARKDVAGKRFIPQEELFDELGL